MTTLQLNQELFNELSVISGDKDKLRQAVKALREIALDVVPSVRKSRATVHKKSVVSADDESWEDYFRNTPTVEFPDETKTGQFVKAANGRVIKQVREWL